MTLKEQGQFFIRGADLLEHGYTLTEVLQFHATVQKEHRLLYQEILNELYSGEAINKVLLKFHFDKHACATIYFAEQHGFLSSAFKESGAYLLRKDSDQKKWRKLLQYPTVLISVLILVTILLQTTLLPRFQLLYGSMGYQPNGLTKVLLFSIEQAPQILLITIFIIVGLITLISLILKRKSAIQKANLIASIPLIKTFYKLYHTVFLSREWSFLIKSGFSLNDVVTIMKRQSIIPLMKETAEIINRELVTGCSFSEALSILNYIDNDMTYIVAHGEKNGDLGKELLYYSQLCNQKLEEKITKIMIIVQPVLFSLIGLVVAIIYISIFLPMFEIIDSI